jgi:hypothetical protein
MSATKPSLGRHMRTCWVFRHVNCPDIETSFILWCSPAKEHKLSDRSSIYRHARAFGSFANGQRTPGLHWNGLLRKQAGRGHSLRRSRV